MVWRVDPASGGFTSRDTLTQAPQPVAQANRYLYGNASPLSSYDLDGHRAVIDDAYGNVEAETTAAQKRVTTSVAK